MRAVFVPAIAGALAATVLTACASTGTTSAPSMPGAAGEGKIVVFAASSLKRAFTEIGERFTADNPGSAVEFSFAGSADLSTQLIQGAPADVFAAADAATMDKVAAAGLLAEAPATFASNTMEIVVAPGNPKKIGTLKDLTRQDLSVVTCAPQVPCGAAVKRVERAGGVTLRPVSEESQVSDVMGKVETGQADAGLVYVTDVLAAGDKVTGVTFAESVEAVNTYPIAVLKRSASRKTAQKFIDIVAGETGRKILAANGFARP